MRDVELANHALFLDLDGTLIDIAPRPDAVVIPEDLVPLLSRLSAALNGALAIVSGRQVADIDQFLAPLKLVAAGSHGAELRTETAETSSLPFGTIDLDLMNAVSKLSSIAAGVIIERKVSSIAVHYRAVPLAGPTIQAALLEILAHEPGHFILCPGRKVFEVVPRHVSKGWALKTLLDLSRFRGRLPIMVGDDVSDLSALEAAISLGGTALRVAGEHFCEEDADFQNPAHVRAWLASLVTRNAA